MSDPFDPAEPGYDEEQPEAGPFPWDAEPLPDDPDAPRERHDAFTEARKSEFLKALVKTGCIREACRRTGIARRTVYRHQELNGSFFDNCVLALRMSGTPLEITAWKRAVEGVEEQFAVAGQVQVRRRYDGSLLRLLLQGSNPKKYGPRPGFKRKRLLKHEKKQMEREIRAEIAAKRMSFDEAMEKLDRQLDALGQREEPKRIAAGWTKIELEGHPRGYLIPPGYGPIAGAQPAASAPDGSREAGEGVFGTPTPRDSM